MTLDQALRAAVADLNAAGVPGAGRDARLLLASALDVPSDRISLMRGDALAEPAFRRFNDLVAQRCAGKPVSKIIGRRLFWGRSFRVTEDVLDPRPESETLIATALDLGPRGRILDLGTGSGILALTLLAEWPDAQGMATDISDKALAVCAKNPAFLGVHDRLGLVRGDWFAPVQGRFDLILSNPPYIAADEMPDLSREVRDHDPEIALTPGGDGLDAYRAITSAARTYMTPGGVLLFEIGPRQGAAVAGMLKDRGFTDVEIRPDMDGRDRVVLAHNPA